MFKRNQIQKTLLVSALALSTAVCIAQETITSQASITVQNAFNLAENAPISFGTVTVKQGATNQSTYVIQPDGTATPSAGADATFTVITPGTAGQYAIDSAAPFTSLNIVATTTTVNLVNAAAPGTNGFFTLGDIFFGEDGVGGAGSATSASIDTDVNGELAFNMGATLTVPSGTLTYVDGSYVGNHTITVSY